MSVLRRAVGGTFVVLGTLHFTHTRVYESIMPGYLPAHRELVLVSGAAEIAGGAGVLVPQTRRLARWWLLALLVAVFPANVNMAVNEERYPYPAWALWLRLPFQALFGGLVWRVTEG